MFKFILLGLIILSNAGCSTVPFQRTSYTPLGSVDPQLVRKEFASSLPDKFQIINTVVFQYKWQSFSALGYIDADRELKTFAISCLNPVGIKLFELTGDRDTINPIFVLKELVQRKGLSRAIGEGIRIIYFDMLPSAQAKIEKEKYRIIFSQPSGVGLMKYIFAGSHHWLIEKHYYEKNRKLWSVYYYGYLMDKGRLYPTGLILKHHRFGYNLIIRLKEVR